MKVQQSKRTILKRIRPRCPRCAGRIRWLTPESARRKLGPVALSEMAAGLPGGQVLDVVWVCVRCSEHGAFGDYSSGVL